MWLVFGVLSVVFTGCNLFFDPRKKGSTWIMIAAFSFPVLTVLAAFGRINSWIAHEDWIALMDVVSSWSAELTGFAVLMIALNALAMLRYRSLHNT